MTNKHEAHETQFEDDFSREIWEKTYKNPEDKTVDDTFRRVAKAIASVEKTDELKAEWEAKFFEMLQDFKVVPGGRILANAGAKWGGTTLMNCFVAPRYKDDPDSIKGIMRNLLNQATTLKSEGGWGENFSYIRPRGSFIKGIGVESPGSLAYMSLFNESSSVITQGSGVISKNPNAKGKIRKGAQMAVLDCTSPDIVEFITAKQTAGKLSKFNISINCTSKFMDQLKAARAAKIEGNKELFEKLDKWDLIFPDTTIPEHKTEWDGFIQTWIEKGLPVNVYQTVSITGLWDLIMKSTYNRAEPGVLFMDRANYWNPLYYGEKIQSTNPCGEQLLAPSGVCCLGSINVTQFINKDRTGFDLLLLKEYVHRLVRFLDNVNSYSSVPLPEYKDSMEKKRRIGCGIMGWGSALFMLKLRLASEEASKIRDELIHTIASEAYKASIDLAIEKGMFEYCQPDLHAAGPFVQKLNLPKEYLHKLKSTGIRNSSLLSIQPTGSSSIFSNIVSGGLEPIFMPEYIRTVICTNTPDEIKGLVCKWEQGEFTETDTFKFTKEGDETILRGIGPSGTVYKVDTNRGLTKEVLCEDYGVRFLKRLGEWDPKADWAVTTTELSADDHVNDLKGFANYVDSAISKTINLPFDYSFEDFENLYLDAYDTGTIKGLTTYRSGTMTSVLSAVDEKTNEVNDEEIVLEDVKLPDDLPATLKTLRAEGRKWYVTLIRNEDQTRPVALFVQTNAQEKNVTAQDSVDRLLDLARHKGIPEKHVAEVEKKMAKDNNTAMICRTISLLLRHGILIRNIVATLEQVDCVAGSFVFHIRKFLASYIKDGEKVSNEKCGECGSENVQYKEGCKVCGNCGSSKCG